MSQDANRKQDKNYSSVTGCTSAVTGFISTTLAHHVLIRLTTFTSSVLDSSKLTVCVKNRQPTAHLCFYKSIYSRTPLLLLLRLNYTIFLFFHTLITLLTIHCVSASILAALKTVVLHSHSLLPASLIQWLFLPLFWVESHESVVRLHLDPTHLVSDIDPAFGLEEL